MSAVLSCACDVIGLAEAVAARGLQLVPMQEGSWQRDLAASRPRAAILGWNVRNGDPGEGVARMRDGGWFGPLMLLLAGGDSVHVARAIDRGADDALALPACPGEIAARVAARLRAPSAMPIRIGDLHIDPLRRHAMRGGRPLHLLPREFALLLHLARRAGDCVDRAELRRAICGIDFDPGTNVIEVHVSRLRAKLDRQFASPMLHTEKGRGYRLAAPVRVEAEQPPR
ncbi:winged helix-turn-helix transcriptional regulator [Stakelama tenebrarum]|uniref:Response regulator transcription factor n=1 Tax=Stakelama tenebrarum TaxID=2711215 RepID=A0A6G6Y2T7_9SPHN|nr:response regulator transcription factor [Sphingosinithalassobacter tenebrarum]QIG78923.1 response regulator transcription factor [Sphingosinithalassobacter tenebrarum]